LAFDHHTSQRDFWERNDLGRRRNPTHPVVKAYVLSKILEIQKHISIETETTLLDVGCGNGFFTTHFNQICNTIGIDSSKKMIELNPNKNVSVMDARKIEYPNDTFDIVFCHALLHHVVERDKVIQEMKRVSKRFVIILEPNRNNPFMYLFALIVKEERGALIFSLKYLKNFVEINGLRIMTAFSQGCIVPNKFPTLLLPFVKGLDCLNAQGVTNFIICEK